MLAKSIQQEGFDSPFSTPKTSGALSSVIFLNNLQSGEKEVSPPYYSDRGGNSAATKPAYKPAVPHSPGRFRCCRKRQRKAAVSGFSRQNNHRLLTRKSYISLPERFELKSHSRQIHPINIGFIKKMLRQIPPQYLILVFSKTVFLEGFSLDFRVRRIKK